MEEEKKTVETTEEQGKKTFFTAKNLAKIAVFAVLGFVVTYLEFPLFPAVVPWLKLDFSNVFTLMGGFALGPISVLFIEFVKQLLCLFFKSSTGGVGEIANLLMGVAFALPASIFYRRNKTRKVALFGMLIGIALQIVAACFANYFILIPALMGGVQNLPLDPAKYIFVYVTVFNLIKGVTVAAVTFVLYKHISKLLKRI